MNHNKGVTLIELMVVVIVLGILAVIAVPNIKNIKGKAQISATLENKNTVQKGLDRYFLDKQELPTTAAPTKEIPAQIDWSKLKPEYIRDNPNDLGKMHYWVDYNGAVWISDVDAPTGVTLSSDGKTITWNSVDGANSYKVGYYEATANNSKIKIFAGDSYKLLQYVNGTSFTSSSDLNGKNIVVSAVSKYLESVPVGIGYMKYQEEKIMSNCKPTAVISMTPNVNIDALTNIIWSSASSTDSDGSIVASEWQLDENTVTSITPNGAISKAGDHTMKLRVQDEKNAWSDWTSLTFHVSYALDIGNIMYGVGQSMYSSSAEGLPIYNQYSFDKATGQITLSGLIGNYNSSTSQFCASNISQDVYLKTQSGMTIYNKWWSDYNGNKDFHWRFTTRTVKVIGN